MKKNLILSLFIGLGILNSNAQNVDFLSLSNISMVTTENYIANERVIVMEGNIVSQSLIPIDLLSSSNVSQINGESSEWNQIFADLSAIRLNINNLPSTFMTNNQNGTAINPGTYAITGDLNLNGFVSLNGEANDKFIFNISGNLNYADFTTLSMEGINPKNVIWNVNGNVTSGHNSVVGGIYLAASEINFENHIMGPVTLFSESDDIKLSSLLNIHSPNGQAVVNPNPSNFDSCQNPSAGGGSGSGPSLTPGTSCSNGNSSILADPSNWKVDANFNQNTPLIEVGVNFHIFQDGSGGNNYQDNVNGDRLVLLQLFDWARSLIRHPTAPTNPIASVCGTCHISDTKIQLVLKKTEFYQSNSLNTSKSTAAFKVAMNNRDPEMIKDLNIFWTQGPNGTVYGFANRSYNINGSTNQHFIYSAILGSYKGQNIYNPNSLHQGNYATAITIAHEVGHNLDFPHTYSGGGASAVCNTADINYLDDVHGPVGSQTCPHNPPSPPGLWGCAPGSTAHCTNNVMSGNYTSSYLSPKQIGMAHTTLRTKSMRQKITNCPYSTTPLEVTTSQTWDKDIFFFRDVVVKNNSILTITCNVGMPESGKIIVEKGSKLVIDGGHLSNSCKEKYWLGIILRGDNNNDQLPLLQPTNQAKLEVKNGAIIENVMYAVRFGLTGSWDDFGALVEAEDATFKVVRRAVEFMKYTKTNHSTFKNCTFQYADGITQTPLSLITAWDNHGAIFYGCAFEDNTGINDYYDYVANGFFSIDATYKILPACSTATLPCPPADIIKSKFINLNQGVYATGSAGPNQTVAIESAEFTNNSISTRIEGLDNVRFIKNDIENGGLVKNNYLYVANAHQIGFYSKYSTGFEVEQNSFEKTGTLEPTIGVNIKRSGSQANEVYNNVFKNNEIGQKYDSHNKSKASNYVGLQFLCNTNPVNNFLDVEVNKRLGFNGNRDGVRNYQGSNSASAGNIFSTTSTRLDNNTFQNINYYYTGSAQHPNPNNSTGIGPVVPIANSNSDMMCATRFMVRLNGNLLLPTNMVADYYGKRADYDNLLYTYYQNIDNGNTDSLLQAIGLTFPNEAQQLRDDLMSQAPYLSQNALMDAAASGILTDALLLEICLANPEATFGGVFLEFLEFEIPNPLPANMVQLIYQNWDSENPRTLLELQLADLSAELGRMSNQLIHYYVENGVDNTDSIENILKSRKDLMSKYQQVELAIEIEDFAKAHLLLNAIQNNNELNSEQVLEHNNLDNYVDFREGLVNQQTTYMQLDESQLTTLRSIADAHQGRTAKLARNILCFGYAECENNFPSEPELRTKGRRVYDMNEPINATEQQEGRFNLYPNPATELVQVKIANFKADNVYSIQLKTMEGKLIREQKLVKAMNTIEVANLKKATYIFILFEEGKQIDEVTLIKQ